MTNLPRCDSPGLAGTLCLSCAYSPVNQRNMGVTGRVVPAIKPGGCKTHALYRPAPKA